MTREAPIAEYSRVVLPSPFVRGLVMEYRGARRQREFQVSPSGRLVARTGSLAVTLLLSLAACTSSSDSQGLPSGASTTIAAASSIAWSSRYPPIPPAPGNSITCVGRSTGLTQDQANQIALQAGSLAGAQLQMTTPCPSGPVFVGLMPGNEDLAQQLQQRFGRNIVLSVGLNRYDGAPTRSPRCGVLPEPTPAPVGLTVTLRTELDHSTITTGQNFEGKVLVAVTKGHLAMDTGQPLQAVVLEPGTRQVIGVYNGAIGGTGYAFDLSPGQSEGINFIGGTARCDGGIGSTLSPGEYQVTIRVAPETTPSTPVFWAPPVAIRLT